MEYFIKNLWPIIKKDIINILAYIGVLVTIKDVFEFFNVTIYCSPNYRNDSNN